jgi:hypothetical protein
MWRARAGLIRPWLGSLRCGRNRRRTSGLVATVRLADKAHAGPDLGKAPRRQRAEAFAEKVAIDRCDLGDVDDGRPREAPLPSPQTHIPRECCVLQLRGDRDDYRGRQVCAVEAIVLKDDRRAPACWLGTA